jgi:hypothetical protein
MPRPDVRINGSFGNQLQQAPRAAPPAYDFRMARKRSAVRIPSVPHRRAQRFPTTPAPQSRRRMTLDSHTDNQSHPKVPLKIPSIVRRPWSTPVAVACGRPSRSFRCWRARRVSAHEPTCRSGHDPTCPFGKAIMASVHPRSPESHRRSLPPGRHERVQLTLRPPSRTLNTNASAATNV